MAQRKGGRTTRRGSWEEAWTQVANSASLATEKSERRALEERAHRRISGPRRGATLGLETLVGRWPLLACILHSILAVFRT